MTPFCLYVVAPTSDPSTEQAVACKTHVMFFGSLKIKNKRFLQIILNFNFTPDLKNTTHFDRRILL